MDWWTPVISSLCGVVLGAVIAIVADRFKERKAARVRAYQELAEDYKQLLSLLAMTRGDVANLTTLDQLSEDTLHRLERNVKWAVDLAVVLDVPQPVLVAIQVLDETLPEIHRLPRGKDRLKAVLRAQKAEDDVVQECRRTLASVRDRQ